MTAFAGHASALVADVDCTTAGGKPLCDEIGVRGYPSIKYGDVNDLQDYEGARSFAALQKFADENLGPQCGPDNIDLCDEEKKAMIVKFQAMSEAELDAAVTEKNELLEKADKDLQSWVDKANKDIKELTAKKESTIADIKASGLGLMKAVEAHQKTAKKEL